MRALSLLAAAVFILGIVHTINGQRMRAIEWLIKIPVLTPRPSTEASYPLYRQASVTG
ncbi:hypothetical protein SAMN02799616_04869 [Paenibacillus sp. UNC499MF]|nr:hypothetical protein SAMN02799616_04869 [Paenibacillus sp. UNC499MF]